MAAAASCFAQTFQRADNGLVALLNLCEALGVCHRGHRVRLRPARDDGRNEIGFEVAKGYGLGKRQGFRNVSQRDGIRDPLEGFGARGLVTFRQGHFDGGGGLFKRHYLRWVNGC